MEPRTVDAERARTALARRARVHARDAGLAGLAGADDLVLQGAHGAHVRAQPVLEALQVRFFCYRLALRWLSGCSLQG